MSSSARNLTDVPEEDPKSQMSLSSPYSTTTPTASSSNVSVNVPHRTARKPPSVRTLGRSSNDQLPSASGSVKRVSSNSSSSSTVVANGAKTKTPRNVTSHSQIPSTPVQKYQANPELPHDKDAKPVPSTVMYWSRAPVWGTVPMRTMRAHSVTLVDTTAWIFGGCDDKDGSKDIYCFDTGMSKDFSCLEGTLHYISPP
jgi:Rab9 effector protein with kelch motifs